MRRYLLLCSALLVGCATSEPPATPTEGETPMATLSLADVAGTWKGTVMAADSDAAVATIELLATADPGGWSMTVTNANDPSLTRTVPASGVYAEGDSLIVDVGPFQSILRVGQEVSTHSVYRMQDGNLVGTALATYPASGETVLLRTVLSRQVAH